MPTWSVSWLPDPANTPIFTGNRRGSHRMSGYKPHLKFRFFLAILPNIFPVITSVTNRQYREHQHIL